MSTPEIRELESRLRRLKKAERKKNAQRLGHPAKKQGAAYSIGEHEYIVDPIAKTKRRMEIFRNAGGEVIWFDEADPYTIEELRPANCQGCAETHLVGWFEGEWDHICELEKHCDSAKCGIFRCKMSHFVRHNRILVARPGSPKVWGTKAAAIRYRKEIPAVKRPIYQIVEFIAVSGR
jgi:hypothetical protein